MNGRHRRPNSAPFHWEHTLVEVDARDGLALDVWSVGPPDADATVLALHGFPQSARSFRRVGELLAARGVRVIAPDQRGYSPTARPTSVEAYRVDRLANDVLSLANALQIDGFHLVGHDWGAQVGWVGCRDFPSRIESFIALSVPHPTSYAWAFRTDEDQRNAAAYIRTFWQPGVGEESLLRDDASGLRRLLEDLPSSDLELHVERMSQPNALTCALNWYRAMESVGDAFPMTTVPTTYVWGSQDPALRRSGAERCGRYVDADYRFIELDAGHWLPELASDDVALAVLDRISSPRA